MNQLLRHRRASYGLLAVAIFVLFHMYSSRSPSASNFEEITISGSLNASDSPYSPENFADISTSEPPAYKHSVKWTNYEEIPESRAFAHIPGFTVLENVYSVNGTIFLVKDHKKRLPAVDHILSAWAEIPGGQTLVGLPTEGHIRIINRKTAIRLFGLSARELRGTTWLYNNPLAYTDESFALEFLRTHYMQEHRTSFNETLLPPTRVLFPKISNRIQHTIPGLSSIPRLLFPSTSVGFKEDWDDYAYGHRPIILQSVVILDRAAAARNPILSSSSEHTIFNLEVLSPLTGFRTIDGLWWSTWRRKMLEMLGDSLRFNVDNYALAQPVITYLVHQQPESGAFLSDEHHDLLVKALRQLGKDRDYEINIIDPRDVSLLDRIKVMLRTTILLGATGPSLDNVMWMPPSYSTLLIEFFPYNYISSKQFHIAKAIGIEYMAWRDSVQILSPGSAPPPSTHVEDLREALETATIVDPTPLIQLIVNRLEKDQGEEVDEMRI